MIDYTATYTDQYQLTMAQAYFLEKRADTPAVFDYFFRSLPFSGGYAIFAGLETLIDALENLRFDAEDLEYLGKAGFHPKFVDALRDFRFRGTIHAAMEGDLIFPTRPILQVEGGLLEAQLIETLLLNTLNFQSLIATKAARIRQVASHQTLIEFGLRRAQGPGGYYASRAAVVGGFDATSDVRAGRDFGIPISGTMAHSFVQSYDDELTAFRRFAEVWPDQCVLLVDTYDTLRSGLPHAIQVGHELKKHGHRLLGIRLDSGDLAYLARRARQMLDEAGLHEVKIAASNQLSETVIKSLNEQRAPIDIFGVGTELVTGSPDAALDGVYKLVFSGGRPRIKISESLSKVTLPDRKQVYRLVKTNGRYYGADIVALRDENPDQVESMHHPFDLTKSLQIDGVLREPLLHKVMEGGRRLAPPRTLHQIRSFAQERLSLLPEEYLRFINPHIYKVGLSDQLMAHRQSLVEKYRGRVG